MCLFFSFLSFVSDSIAKIKVPSVDSGGCSCLQRWFWPDSSIVFHRCLEPDLRNPVAFLKTRAPQPSSPSSSAPAAGSTALAGRQSSACGLHAPERSLFFGARDGQTPLFSGRAPWGCGLWRLIFGWVAPVMACAPTRRRLRQCPPCLCCRLPGFLCYCLVVLCILLFLLYSLHVYCLDFIGIFVGLVLDRPSFI